MCVCGDRERGGDRETGTEIERKRPGYKYTNIHSRESVKNIDLHLKTFSATSKNIFFSFFLILRRLLE